MNHQGTRESIQNQSQKQNRFYCGRTLLAVAATMIFILGVTTQSWSADTADLSGDKNHDLYFPTFNNTGLDTCADDKGRPVILLFSMESCSHCKWAGDMFDFIVRYYQANGLVEAHHYDIVTGDDHLTDEIETEIPPAHLQIKEYGDPKGLVPYYNFSCRYERIGNGYEEEGDISAEGEEIRRVIETLLQN